MDFSHFRAVQVGWLLEKNYEANFAQYGTFKLLANADKCESHAHKPGNDHRNEVLLKKQIYTWQFISLSWHEGVCQPQHTVCSSSVSLVGFQLARALSFTCMWPVVWTACFLPPEVCNTVEQSYHPADNGGLKLYKEHDEVRWMSLKHASLLRSYLCLSSRLSCGKLMIRCPEEILENRNANPGPPPMIPLGRVWSC